MMRRAALLLGLLLAGSAMAGTQVLHRSAAADPPSLDPNLGSGTPAAPILSDLVEGLVTRDRRSRPAPGSASQWSVSDDGLTWTFQLREDLRWSDGEPLDAEDFAWSFRRLLDPATAAPAAGLFLLIENAPAVFRGELPVSALGVQARDTHTLEIRLAHPAPWFVQLLANTQAVPVPRHVIERHGREWTRAGKFVGNGPFTLAERVPQSHLRLVRNPHYHEASEVALDEVWWHPTQDLGASFRRFRAGEIDILLNLPPDQLGWVEQNMPGALHTGPIKATWLLLLNPASEALSDVRVRRALSLAIDREALAFQVLRTGVRPATTLVAPDFADYPPVLAEDHDRPLAQRQALARELLAAAGYGPRRPLSLPVIYDTQEENRQILVAVAAMWRAIGVQAELVNLELSGLLRRVRTGDFVVARSQAFALYDDPHAFLQQFRSTSPTNWMRWTSPDYDALVEQSNRLDDPAERGEQLARAEQLLLANQPLVPIYHYVGKVLVAPRVRGWYNAPLGTTPSRYLSVDPP
ncbi:MAG: peptide ABC transporter substrate-binding protein [Chromatiales bacterium]|nr:peptide ABC transporter substrate-binding protein [Chromatiales bacterium]